MHRRFSRIKSKAIDPRPFILAQLAGLFSALIIYYAM